MSSPSEPGYNEKMTQVASDVFEEVFGDCPFPVQGPDGRMVGGTQTGPGKPSPLFKKGKATVQKRQGMLRPARKDKKQEAAFAMNNKMAARIKANRKRAAAREALKKAKRALAEAEEEAKQAEEETKEVDPE